MLSAQFTDSGTGHGTIEMTMPDGEVRKGEYSVVRGGAVQFGSIFESVYAFGSKGSSMTESSTTTMSADMAWAHARAHKAPYTGCNTDRA